MCYTIRGGNKLSGIRIIYEVSHTVKDRRYKAGDIKPEI